VVAVLLLGGGCGGDDADVRSGASPSAEEAEADEADVAALEGYVSAMAAGDVEAAMEHRCRDVRIAPSEHEAFERQLRDLLEDEGELGLARVELGERDPAVVPELEGRHAVLLRYWLSFDGVDVAEPLLTIVANDEGGQRRLCSQQTAVYLEVIDEQSEGVADLGAAMVPTLAELMPQGVGPDPRLVSDAAVDLSLASGPLEGARDGWMRRWQNADGGATVAAYRYASPTEAQRHAEAWLAEQANGTIETFAIPDVAGARGQRRLAKAWLWVQPPTVGPYIDEITMVFGDIVVIAGVLSSAPDGSHEPAISQAREIVGLAAAG